MPDISITYRNTSELIPYARNSRTHSEAQVAQIAGSIREFGFANPVLIDGENGIIAGHGRLLAAQKLNIDTIPCIVLDHLTKAQQRALVIADNKLAMNAGWDNEMLSLELGELKGLDVDLDLLGFDADELSTLMGYDDRQAPDSSTKEIDPDNYQMGCRCPKCGFEFDDK